MEIPCCHWTIYGLHQDQQPLCPEGCTFQYSGLPRSSLTLSEPLSVLFIILGLVTPLILDLHPLSFSYARCSNSDVHGGWWGGGTGIVGQVLLLGLIRDIFSISLRCQKLVPSLYYSTGDPVVYNPWKENLYGLSIF